MPDLTQSEPRVCTRCGGGGVFLWGGPFTYWHKHEGDCIAALRARLDALEARTRQDVAAVPSEGA